MRTPNQRVRGLCVVTAGPAVGRSRACNGFPLADKRGRDPFVGSHKHTDETTAYSAGTMPDTMPAASRLTVAPDRKSVV